MTKITLSNLLPQQKVLYSVDPEGAVFVSIKPPGMEDEVIRSSHTSKRSYINALIRLTTFGTPTVDSGPQRSGMKPSKKHRETTLFSLMAIVFRTGISLKIIFLSQRAAFSFKGKGY